MSSSKPKKAKDKSNGKGPKKDYTIIVNGRQKTVPKKKKELSFSEVIGFAYDNPPSGPNTIFTVNYRRGKGNKPEGSLVKGDEVKIKDEMIFNVTSTNKS